MILSQFKKIFEVFIQTWKGIYWQNFLNRQIGIQLILSLIITENLQCLKISNWAQQLKIVCLSY